MYELRGYQQKAHDATIEHCKNSKEPAFIGCTVGGGKTVLIAAIAKHVSEKGGKVLVLARQGELVNKVA